MKYSFKNDYSEGAHLSILAALQKSNSEQQIGYGEDRHTLKAIEQIKAELKYDECDIHLISGGTQTNLIALASMMKPYESVIAAETAHIYVHEAGAIEATGHRINTIATDNGKITPEPIRELVKIHEDEHMVKPKVVFISNTTEVGTHYSKSEIEAISEVCRELGLYFYLDGARLGSALMVSDIDLKIDDLPGLVDMFYIGGTKNGALLGEALVIINDELKEEFRRRIKQRGALLAKGRVIGIQFEQLFKDGLFYDLASHANKMAMKLVAGISDAGYGFHTESSTNQIFPTFPNDLIAKLEQDYEFYVWVEDGSGESSIRLVTSWATEEKFVDEFISDLKSF